MKKTTKYLRSHIRQISWLLLASLVVASVLLFRLGSITASLSPLELASGTHNWGSLVHQPFDLPLNFVRALLLSITGDHSIFGQRLPSVIFGAATILLFAILIKFWHGNRTSLLATALFACNAWLLHVSRLASSDVLYLWSIPLLLGIQLAMLRHGKKPPVLCGSMMVCGLLLYIPGLIWFVALSLYWQRAAIVQGWKRFKLWWQRTLYVLAGVIWLPLLLAHLNNLSKLKTWLGLPQHFEAAQIGRQLAFVPVHLLVRGPHDPQRWLGHAPLLDAFSLIVVLTGIWFYVSHYKAIRSRLLGSYWLLGIILVGLGGSVGLSILVPLLYVFAATGIAYLLHEWLRVFPRNPIARQLGIGLVVAAVLSSCAYNLRAYYVAWPHNPATLSTFAAPAPVSQRNLVY